MLAGSAEIARALSFVVSWRGRGVRRSYWAEAREAVANTAIAGILIIVARKCFVGLFV